MEMDYATNGKGNLGVTLGAIGTGLAALNNGGLLSGILGGGKTCSDDHCITRYEAAQQARIGELENEVKMRDANTYTIQQIDGLRTYVDGKLTAIDSKICAQAVHNATSDAVIGCLQGQIAQLMGLTRTVIPLDGVCPSPMPQYNSWTAPTATAGT